MRKTLAALIVGLVCVAATQGASAMRERSAASLPSKGVLAPGVSLGGVRLGYTPAKVKQLWGANYKVCPECKNPTWYWFYQGPEPLGAAVKFKQGKVVAAFTLGSPTGWRTQEGLLMGEQIDKVLSLYGQLKFHGCIGFSAMSMRSGNTVTSIYTTGASVYGFAITAPAEPVCQ